MHKAISQVVNRNIGDIISLETRYHNDLVSSAEL